MIRITIYHLTNLHSMSKTRVELGGMSANKDREKLKLINLELPTWRSSSSTVAKLGRDDQLPLAANLHPHHSDVPALDDLP